MCCVSLIIANSKIPNDSKYDGTGSLTYYTTNIYSAIFIDTVQVLLQLPVLLLLSVLTAYFNRPIFRRSVQLGRVPRRPPTENL